MVGAGTRALLMKAARLEVRAGKRTLAEQPVIEELPADLAGPMRRAGAAGQAADGGHHGGRAARAGHAASHQDTRLAVPGGGRRRAVGGAGRPERLTRASG